MHPAPLPTRPPKPLSWFHPEFQLEPLFLHWCHLAFAPLPVQGFWQTLWSPAPLPEPLLNAPLPADPNALLRVGNRASADQLHSLGFSNVILQGFPCTYLPTPCLPRLPQSLLLLLSGAPEEAPALRSLLLQTLASLPPLGSPDLRLLGVCLPPPLYQLHPQWVWELREKGLLVLPFEENPNQTASLREAAALFSQFTFVSGNRPGHWLPHAALRGARVSLLPAPSGLPLPSPALPEPLFHPPLHAGDSTPWARLQLGAEHCLPPKDLAASFTWPHTEIPPLPPKPSLAPAFLLQNPAQRVCLELASQDRLPWGLQTFAALHRQLPDSPHVSAVYASLLSAFDHPLHAQTVLASALSASPHDPDLLCLQARHVAANHNLPEAVRLLQLAIAHAPQVPAPFLQLASLIQPTAPPSLTTDLLRSALQLAKNAPPETLWPSFAIRSQPHRLLLVSCSAKPAHQADQLLLVRSFHHVLSFPHSGIDLDLTFENRSSLPSIYNAKLLAAAEAGYEFVAFVHDDVYLDDAALQTKLQRAHRHNGFHLIGVAGCLEPTIQHPSLWHLMAPRHQLRGSVQYFHNNDESRGCVFYGPSPSPADLLDGLFLAVHVPSALATGWRFNERFRFHHYDLAASLDAHRHGMRTGVAPIQLIHASPGLGNLEDPEWKPSDLLFRQLYAPSPA